MTLPEEKQQTEWVITASYAVNFTNRKPIPISVLANSLMAQEKLIKRSEPFLEKIFTDIKIDRIDAEVNEIKSGSLTEDLLVKLIFNSRENYEKAKDLFSDIAKTKNVATLGMAISFGVAAYMAHGWKKAQESLQLSGRASTHIENYHNYVFTNGEKLGLKQEDIKSILESPRDQTAIAKDSISAIAPAMQEEGASIQMQVFPELSISPELIQEVPEEYISVEPNTERSIHEKVELEIWASDRENRAKVWAGVVHGITDRRIRFILDESIDPDMLHGQRLVLADIILTKKYDVGKKEFVPARVEVVKIHKADEETP